MADPVATVEKIVKIGLKIKAAVDTVRHNQEECQEIRKCVLRISAILSQLQQTGMMGANPAMSGALQDLEESLQNALELVISCQQETSTLRRLITAGDLSKQLRRVKDDILVKVQLATFAINTHTTIVLLTIQAGGHHPHPPPQKPEDAAVGISSHNSQSTDDTRSELYDMETNLLGRNEGAIPIAIKKFRWSEVKAATNSFSDGNIIHRSPDSSIHIPCIVYKGVLKDGSIVVVKKYDEPSYSIWRTQYRYDYSVWEYDANKVLVRISNLQHRNIVKFLGYSHEVLSTSVVHLFKRKKGRANKETKFFWVEEYVPNGTLDGLLRGSRDSQLEWSSLFRIIEGVAQGLQYLHEHRIVHMDVKPGNILLDSGMNAVISDFSISLALGDDDEMTAAHLAGTVGYLAPEHLERIVSTKNDVYAFGITLIEAVGSIRISGSPSDTGCVSDRWEWAWKAWEAGRTEEEFDPSLFEESQLTQMKRCVGLGLLCTQYYREDRPTMADVLEILRGHKELPAQKIPFWFQGDSNTSPVELKPIGVPQLGNE